MQQMNGNIVPTPSMSFGDAVKTCFKKYATFSGRARRSEFWWFYLAISIVNACFYALFMVVSAMHSKAAAEFQSNVNFDDILNGGMDQLRAQAEATDSQYQTYYIIIGILMVIWGLITLLPYLAAMVRRLHDTGKSGHLLWLFLACGVGGLIPFIMCIPDGNPAPNQYGESPKYKPAAPNAPQV